MRRMLAILFALSSSQAFGNEFDGLSIQATRIKPSQTGTEIVYTVRNDRGEAVNGLYVACSLYDSSGEPLASAEGIVSNIPPKEEVVGAIKTRTIKVAKANCRPTGFTAK